MYGRQGESSATVKTAWMMQLDRKGRGKKMDLFDLKFKLQAHVLELRVEGNEVKVTATHFLPDRKICQIIIVDECFINDFYQYVFKAMFDFRKAIADWRERKHQETKREHAKAG